ncbi:Kinesin-like protein [Quillaja saponaria]|uniref:Kinesin-like protein n=1 Tax=Quillaja saponaria TaxID=32244 RepID=A0AAD7Q837_QUISA|nr:Kinesin-like protein [Quillaja saponaria]
MLKSSALKPIRPKRDIGPLVPFKELVNETDTSADQSCEEDDDNRSDTSRNCSLPDPCALLHVTNRRKVPQRRKSLSMEDNELTELQAEYEDLLLKFETQMTVNVIQTDCLTKRLNEADVFGSAICNDYSTIRGNYNGDKSVLHKDSEAILVIKKLQEQIKMLEMDKSSSQQNLDSVVELATEQNICAREKFEELYEEVLRAKEEARVAHEQLNSKEIVRKIDEGNFDFVINVSMEIQELMLELQNSKSVVQNVFSLVEEVSSSFSALFDVFLDIKSLISQNTLQQQQIISNYDKLNSCMRQKVAEVENEKIVLDNQLTAIQKQILELKRDAENSQNSLMALSGEEDLEKAEMLSYIQTLRK